MKADRVSLTSLQLTWEQMPCRRLQLSLQTLLVDIARLRSLIYTAESSCKMQSLMILLQ